MDDSEAHIKMEEIIDDLYREGTVKLYQAANLKIINEYFLIYSLDMAENFHHLKITYTESKLKDVNIDSILYHKIFIL